MVFELRGGLGNQMFQVAAGAAAAARTQRPLILDVGSIPRDGPNRPGPDHSRRDLLDVFPSLRGLQRHAPWPEFPGGGFIRAVRARLRDGKSTYSEPVEQTGYDPVFETRLGCRYFRGYFMSPRYFSADVRYQPQALFRLSGDDLSPWARSNLAAVDREQPIAVHVRMGDYAKHQDVYGVLEPKYFARAIDLVRRRRTAAPVWLFSDEPEEARAALSFVLDPDVVVTPPEGEHPVSSIMLMARSSAVIGANSSFSWWGAFLGDRPDRPVVFPTPHFASPATREPRDYYPAHWARMARG